MKKLLIKSVCIFLIQFSLYSQDKTFDFSLNIKKNFNSSLIDVVGPVSSTNSGIIPYIGFGLNNSSILGRISLYAGFGYQEFNAKGDFEYKDNSASVLAEGNFKLTIGYYSPLIGGKFFLTNKSTRPYINAHYRLYIPNLKTSGELITDDETYTWNANKDIGKLFKNHFLISNAELGFGVEHKFNNNLALFGEFNLQSFALKVKIDDAEDYIDDLTIALDNLESAGIDIDVEDFQFVEGHANTSMKYMSSYASLGIAFYF